MKKLLVVLLFLASSTFAQEAVLNAPVARPAEAKITVGRVDINGGSPALVVVTLKVQSSSNEDIRLYNVVVPDDLHESATVVGFLNAFMSSAAGETGSVPRRANFRVLKYLSDHGYLPGATVNP